MSAMSATEPPAASRPVASVARAVALLDALAANPEGLGVNELARRIGVNASTASRLLATLERGRLVERAPGGPFRLGLGLVALADGVLARLDVRDLARPRLRQLVARTGETATLSIPGGAAAVTIDFVPAESSVVSLARLGRPSAAHATATGKVMLAFVGTGVPQPPLERFTERTIVDPAALALELERVRARGWAQSVGEREEHLNALAAPVWDSRKELLAILGVQGPAARFNGRAMRAALGPLREHAEALSASLGWDRPSPRARARRSS